MGRRWKKRIYWTLGGLGAWFFLHIAVMLWDGFSDETAKADWLVVFGNKVHPNGIVGERLRARLDKALELYNSGLADSIFVSGGVGVEGQPEGTVMKNYLVAAGVPSDVIVADDHGNDTQGTALNFRMAVHDAQTIVILITQYYHVMRAKLAIKRAGFQNVMAVRADFSWKWGDLYSIFREFPGYYAYLFRHF